MVVFEAIHGRILLKTVLVAVFLVAPSCLVAQKTDIIVLPNGDRITGEIKLLDRGRLDYSTDLMDRISVDWRQLVKVTSDKYFDFELSNAKRYFGRIEESGQDGRMVIASDTGRVLVNIRDVVRIEPLHSTFWGRLKGSSIELGFDFTRANLQRVWNLTTKFVYRARLWQLNFGGSSYLNFQESADPSKRFSASLSPQRFLPKGYMAFAVARAESNDELSLVMRATAGAGASRFLARTNNVSFEAGLGMAATREQFEGSDFTSNLEGVALFDFSKFRFIVPKIDLRIYGILYPSITDWGRLRNNSNVSIQWEPIKDYKLGLNGYFEWDSRPSEGSEKIDYGIFSTIGVTV